MKIAHISDLHICSAFKKINLTKTRRLLEYILKEGYDHIAITGDITHKASQREFEEARKLFETLNILDSRKLSLAIGNHDIFGGIVQAEEIPGYLASCRMTSYKQRVKEFGEFFSETFAGCIHPLKNELFPYKKNLGPVVLVGMNSIDHYSKLRNPFASNGGVTRREINAVGDLLSKKHKIMVILIHHHFTKKISGNQINSESTLWRNIEAHAMKLRGRKKIMSLFVSAGVNAVLHGHVHDTSISAKQGIIISNAGGSLEGFRDQIIKLNCLNITAGEIEAFTDTIIMQEESENTGPVFNVPAKLTARIAV